MLRTLWHKTHSQLENVALESACVAVANFSRQNVLTKVFLIKTIVSDTGKTDTTRMRQNFISSAYRIAPLLNLLCNTENLFNA